MLVRARPRFCTLVCLIWIFSALLERSSGLIPLTIYQHFADMSLANRVYVCTEEERACFRKNQLLYEEDGKCYTAGEQGPCKSQNAFYLDKQEATRLGGHLRGTCARRCEDISQAPLATTGQCMTKSEVESKICRREWYLKAGKDVFGQWVCEWTRLPCSPPETSQSSRSYDEPYDGTCFAPDIFTNTGAPPPSNDSQITDEQLSDHPLTLYFERNNSLADEYPCDERERTCLGYGRVLHSDGNCYKVREWTGKCEPGQTFHLDLREAQRKGGHLLGSCRTFCRGYLRPLVSTGICADYDITRQICRYEWGMQSAEDLFGQLICECRWTPGPTPAPAAPTPPTPPPAASPGYCRTPDFKNPTSTPNYDRTMALGFRVPCSAKEFACLRQGRVRASGACHALRTRGPCAAGQELLLSKGALARAHLLPTCAPRACEEGSVRLPADGSCLTHEQVVSILCPRSKVALDEFGGWQCDSSGNFPGNLTATVRNAKDGTCQLASIYYYHGVSDQPIA